MAKNAYSTKQVSENLGISTSTLRKWSLLIEDENVGNYKFQRNENNNQRVFYDYDLLALRELKKLTQEDKVTLENAVKSIGTKLRTQSDILASVTEEEQKNTVEISVIERYEEKLDELMQYVKKQDERIEKQEHFNRELIKRLDEQNKYIVGSLEKRDQQLMLAMREVQETKKLIAANEEENKGFFSRLFRK